MGWLVFGMLALATIATTALAALPMTTQTARTQGLASSWTSLLHLSGNQASCNANDAVVAFDWRCGYDAESSTWTSIGSRGGVEMGTTGLTYTNDKGFLFNNVVKTVDVNINPNNMSAVSIEVWFKLEGNLNNKGWIIGSDNGGYDRAICLQDTRFEGVAAAGGSAYTSTLGYPTIYNWYHVVATMENGDDASTVYLQKVSETMKKQQHTPNNGEGLTAFSVGGLASYADHTVNAFIPIVRVWDKMLTETEVTALYNEDCGQFGCATAAPTEYPYSATPTYLGQLFGCHCQGCEGAYRHNEHLVTSPTLCAESCQADDRCKFAMYARHHSKCWIYDFMPKEHDATGISNFTCYKKPTATPSLAPSITPTETPSSKSPSMSPSSDPTEQPTVAPTEVPDFSHESLECTSRTTYWGNSLGNSAHTFHVYGRFGAYNSERQWMLVVGPPKAGSEAWMWNGGGSYIQFGIWDGRQITDGADVVSQTTDGWFTSTWDGTTYKLYVNGVLVQHLSIAQEFTISNNDIALGVAQQGEDQFSGCLRKLVMFRHAMSASEVLQFVSHNSS